MRLAPAAAVLAVVAVVGSGLAGCSHAGTAGAPTRVVVLPLDGVGLPRAEVVRMRRTLSDRIGRLSPVTVVDSASTDRALAATCEEPLTDAAVDCASRVGRRLRASHVVLGAMGGLGSTYVLQVKLVSVRRAAVTRSLEETVFGEHRDQQAIVSDLAQRLLAIRQQPWYRRWWIWTLGAAAVSAAIAVPLATRDTDPYRDIDLP